MGSVSNVNSGGTTPIKDESGASSGPDDGSITVKNGRFYINGEEIPYAELYLSIQLNHFDAVNQALSIRLQDMKDRNNLTKAANDWMIVLRKYRPESSDDKVNDSEGFREARKAFKDKWGFWPEDQFGGLVGPDGDGNFTQNDFDQMIEVVKSKISSLTADNQTNQLEVQVLNNRRQETLDAMSSFQKGHHEVGSTIAHNTD